MKRRRRIGRYILSLLLLLALMKFTPRILFKGEKFNIPPIEERLLMEFPYLRAQLIELKGDTLVFKGGKRALVSRRFLFEKLMVLDTLLKGNESFSFCDLRYDGIVILRE
jgi:hypothetical protein